MKSETIQDSIKKVLKMYDKYNNSKDVILSCMERSSLDLPIRSGFSPKELIIGLCMMNRGLCMSAFGCNGPDFEDIQNNLHKAEYRYFKELVSGVIHLSGTDEWQLPRECISSFIENMKDISKLPPTLSVAL